MAAFAAEVSERHVAGAYATEALLAESSTAWVHRGCDRAGHPVAIKRLKPGAPPQAVLSLYYQARQSMLLKHSGLVSAIEAGEDQAGHYLVMELVDGVSLWRRVAVTGAMPLAAAVRITCQVAQALDCLHAAGIVHCAVTPDHLLMPDEGAAVLTGLGHSQDALAEVEFPRGLDRHEWAQAPEVKAAARSVTPAADVFSLGALLLMMLAGQAPTVAPGCDLVERNLQTADPQMPRAQLQAVAAGIRRCLARDPARRPTSVWQVAHEVCQAAEIDLAEHWSGKPLADVAAATAGGRSRWYLLKQDARQQWRVMRGTWRDVTCLLLRGRLKGQVLAAPTVDGAFRPLAEFAEFAPVLRLAGASAPSPALG